jgi:hypothetical protein
MVSENSAHSLVTGAFEQVYALHGIWDRTAQETQVGSGEHLTAKMQIESGAPYKCCSCLIAVEQSGDLLGLF